MSLQAFQKARALSPSILFFDEMETLVGKRSSENNQSKVQERVLATLLNEMDGVGIRLDRKTDGRVAESHGEAEREVCDQRMKETNVADNVATSKQVHS